MPFTVFCWGQIAETRDWQPWRDAYCSSQKVGAGGLIENEWEWAFFGVFSVRFGVNAALGG